MSYVAKWASLEKKDRSKLKVHFRWGSKVQFLRDQFGQVWSKDYTLVPMLILDSPNQELSF